MLILGLLGMYFDAAVVFVTNSSLFFRLAVAILWFVRQIPPVFLKNQLFGSNSFGNTAECNFVLHCIFAYEHQGLLLIQFFS